MGDRYGPWIDWPGISAKSPIPAGTRHEVRFRDGGHAYDDQPETWTWKHVKSRKDPSDIVAYRVMK